MINVNANLTSGVAKAGMGGAKIGSNPAGSVDFAKTINAVEKHLSKVNELDQSFESSVQDLLTSKNGDINTVVSEFAKADMSFKLLVGVRNKLIEAYKQTMNMQI